MYNPLEKTKGEKGKSQHYAIQEVNSYSTHKIYKSNIRNTGNLNKGIVIHLNVDESALINEIRAQSKKLILACKEWRFTQKEENF